MKVPDLKPIANSSPGKTEGSISIDEIVKRIKCEIRDSLQGRSGATYRWLDKWTISADLSLSISDNSQISPGVVLNHQFLLGNIPGRISNFSQSSSLGLGVQASTTATRTEIVSFSMSVKEIRNEFFSKKTSFAVAQKYDYCAPYGASPSDLTGKLGLKQWVDSAFGPVEDHLLTEGDHKQPKGPSSPGAGPAATPKAALAGEKADASAPDDLPERFKPAYQKITKMFDDLRKEEAKISGAAATVARLGKEQGSAMSEDDVYALGVAQATLRGIINRQREALTTVTKFLQRLRTEHCECSGSESYKYLLLHQTLLAAAIPAGPSLDPPIDAISHQVQFTIAYNASANPTWTMLNFKGPSPTLGNFFSAMDTNIHTLTIVMGEPGSPATNNARSSLTLSTAFQALVPPAPTAAPLFQ